MSEEEKRGEEEFTCRIVECIAHKVRLKDTTKWRLEREKKGGGGGAGAENEGSTCCCRQDLPFVIDAIFPDKGEKR